MKKLFVCLFAFCALLSSCVISEPEMAVPKQEGVTLTFTASHESNNPTRTVLDGTHVLWEPNDAIMIWYSTYYAGFQNKNTEPAPVCDFTGTLQLFSDLGAPDGETYFGAIYPYYYEDDENFSYYYQGIFGNLFVLDEQDAVEGSYYKYAFPCVARTLDSHLYFRNLCGGVILRFSSGCENYESVVFRANGLEPLAAYEIYAQMVDFEDGKGEIPYPLEIDYATPEVKLVAPEGGFKPGVDYYVAMLPCPLRAGFSLAFVNKNGQVAVKKFTGAQEIKRSVFGRPGVLDTGLSWQEVDPVVANPGQIERQWYIEDTSGNQYLFDVGYSIPGVVMFCDLNHPSFFLDEVASYTLKRDLFGNAQLSFGEYSGFYEVSEVDANSMTCREFYAFSTWQDPYPYDMTFSALTSPVVPEYGGLWVEIDGVDYDINIDTEKYPDMYAQFKSIADANDGNLPIVYMNKYGTTNDFKNVDVNGKVAVFNLGGRVTVPQKVANAYAAGAIGVLLINNADGVSLCDVGENTQIPHGSLLKEVGTKLTGVTSLKCFKPTLEQVKAAL